MICPVCGAKCVCSKATDMCCGCHRHKAPGPIGELFAGLAHAAAAQRAEERRQPSLFGAELDEEES